MNVFHLIDPLFSCRLITTLMHFLWQGALVALLAVTGDVLLNRAAARCRYALHVAALAAMIACVAVTFSNVAAPIAAPALTTTPEPIRPAAEFFAPPADPDDSREWPRPAAPAISAVDPRNPVRPAASEPAPRGMEADRSHVPPRAAVDPWRRLEYYAPQIALLYFVGCTVLLGRLVRGTWAAHRLRRLAITVRDDTVVAMAYRQSQALGLRVLPRVAWCAEVSVPLVIGILQPLILLPAAAATGLSPHQLNALLTHELAHIRRYDLVVNLFQRLAESMLFFHPAVWYISRRISTERELACDELVLATGCERLRYADALVRMAELSTALRRPRASAPATSLAASGTSSSEFKRRVMKVLSAQTTTDLRPSRIALLVLLVLIVGTAVSAPYWHFQALAGTPSVPVSKETMPPDGLEFLTPYPKLHGLSLDMTELQFLEIIKQQELMTRKTVAGGTVTHHLGLGDGHTLLVMFGENAKCRGIQRIRGEDDAGVPPNPDRDNQNQTLLKSDPIRKHGDQLVASWVHEGDGHRHPGDSFRIAVLKDGTVIAAGDTNRNRECQIQLAAAELQRLLRELDEVDHCFDLTPGGDQVIPPGQPHNQWDHSADWLRIRRGPKETHVGLVGGWNVGQEEHIPGISTCQKVMARLNSLIHVTRAGGRDEIERLLPVANAALTESFPDLPLLTAADFSSAERFRYPARSIVFRRTGADGENFGVELERRDDGTVNPISVWNGGNIRDVENPLVVRGLDLATVPFTKEWKEMEKLRVLTDSGYTFKPEYAVYEAAPEVWACYLPGEDRFYIEVGNNQRRRKLYGPIAGNPLQVLNPPPVPAEAGQETATANRQRDLSLADLVRVFNNQNQPERERLNQPALTEEEVCAAIQNESWRREDPPLNDQEITAFRDVAESKRVPEYSHLRLETENNTETFVWKKFWRVRLMLPAIGRDGHVGLTIRDATVAEETIDPQQVAWGPPDAEGLTLGICLLPRKARYSIGDLVRLRLFVRNDGPRAVKTLWPGVSVPMPDDFIVTDETGAKVAVTIGHKNWDSPWTTFAREGTLGVGDVRGLTVPYEISMGADGATNRLVGRILNVRPGQTVKLKVREHNGSSRDRPPGESEPESGSIKFTVGEPPQEPAATLPDSGGETPTTGNEKTAPPQPDKNAKSGAPRPAPDEVRKLLKPALLLPDHWILQAVAFDRDGCEVITASNQSFITIRRWDLASQSLISEVKLQADRHGRPFRSGTFKFSGDRRRVIAATDAYVGIWDTATGQLLKQLPFETSSGIYQCAIDLLDCTPDLSVIVGHRALPGRLTLSYDAHLLVWNGDSGEIVQTIVDKGATDLKAIDLSTDGKWLVTTNGNGARIWETSSGQLLRFIPNDNTGRQHTEPDVSTLYTSHVWSVQFSPDGQRLALGDILGVKLFETQSGRLLQQLEGPYRYSSSASPGLVFSPDGVQLARLGTQEKINGDKHSYVVPIWSTQTGAKQVVLHTEANAAAFSEDGQCLAVAFSDMQQALSVWWLNADEPDAVKTSGPGPHSRVDRVEENGHYVGRVAAELIERFQPVWGEPQLGLQYGIALTRAQKQFREGERVPLVVFFRNVSEQPIKFNTAPDYFGNPPRVLDARGEPLLLENIPLLGSIPHYHETLAPGEALGPFYLSIGLGEPPRPGEQHWHPFLKAPVAGRYTLTHTAEIHIAGTKEGEPGKHEQITTSAVEIEIGQ